MGGCSRRTTGGWTPATIARSHRTQIRLDRRRPPDGSRHLITIAELRRFIALLPDWDDVAVGLDAIVLDSATDCAGWCGPGVVAICAWPHDLWDWWSAEMTEEHRHILDLLEVQRVPIEESVEHRELIDELTGTASERQHSRVTSSFAGPSPGARVPAAAHPPTRLGHHHDRITTRAERSIGRGEPYAEAYEPHARADLARLRGSVRGLTGSSSSPAEGSVRPSALNATGAQTNVGDVVGPRHRSGTYAGRK